AAGHARSTYVDFPHHPDRHRLTVSVEQVSPQVRNRPTNDAAAALRLNLPPGELPIRHKHRRLGDPIHVDELGPLDPITRHPRPQLPYLQRLPTEDHHP